MRAVLLLIAVITFLFPLSSSADWPCSSNQPVPMTVASGNQWNVRVVSDAFAGAVIVWQDRRSGTIDKLYAQRVNYAGQALWADGGIPISTTSGFQYYPQVLSDGFGGAFIVWQDNRNGTDYDIYAQRVSGAGILLWGAGGLALCTAAGNQYYPQLATDDHGGIVVAWQDRRSGTYAAYAQRLNGAGVIQWAANGIQVCANPGDQIEPQIAADGLAGGIIAWTDYRAGGAGAPDVYAQRILAATGGRAWAAAGVPVCVQPNMQWNVQIARDTAHGATIVWQDRRVSANDQVYAQRLDSNGNGAWAPAGLLLSILPGPQYYPKVSSDQQGGAVVVWQGNALGIDYDIYAQRLNASGQMLWGAGGSAICTASGQQYYPQVAVDPGSALFVWQDRRSGTHFDIYGQRLSLDGTARWGLNGGAVSLSTADQTFPQLSTDNHQGIIASWADYRSLSGNTDVYAMRVGSNGKPAGGCFRSFTQDSFSVKTNRLKTPVRGVFNSPNSGHIRDSLISPHGRLPYGLYLGIARTDSAKRYGWEYFSRSLYVRNALRQDSAGRPFNRLGKRTFIGALRNPSLKRYNNALSGELLTLKLNIAASDAGYTPAGLGDLIFMDGLVPPNPLNKKTLRQVASFVDSTLTLWKAYGSRIDYVRMDSSIQLINEAFAGTDSITARPLYAKAIRPVSSVGYLFPGLSASESLPDVQMIPFADESLAPEAFRLYQNYPNPFNPVTTIEFELSSPAVVTLKVYNILGQEVSRLFDRTAMEEGYESVEFDASAFASGVYFYRITVESQDSPGSQASRVMKMILIK